MRELRALVIGLAVGAVGAISNVFVSLKAGWSLPVMTTAAVVGLGVARAQKRELGAREAVIATSFASSIAFMTGGGNLAAIPAGVMLGMPVPSAPAMMGWFALSAIFGTLLGPLLGRSLVELRFPTATAAASLIQHKPVPVNVNVPVNDSRKSLWRATVVGGALALIRKVAHVPTTIGNVWTFGVDPSLLLVGVGAIMTWTTAWSTLLGGVITYAVIAPRLVSAGMATADYRSLVAVMVWPAASLLVTSALTELALDAKKLLRRGEGPAETKARWLVPLAPALAALVLARIVFDLAWPALFAAIPIAVLFAYVAARSMGETDAVPTRALAPLAQALAGPIVAPNFTGSAALHAADTLGSLKLARALEVPAVVAVRMRVIGCIVGAAVVVVTLNLVVPDLHALPSAELPAPAVLVWKSVAEVVGAGHLPSTMHAPIAIGAAVGIALALLGRVKRLAPYVPSPMGLGSGMVLPGSAALSIFVGALARRALEPRAGLPLVMAIASGVIAGESLVSLALQLHR